MNEYQGTVKEITYRLKSCNGSGFPAEALLTQSVIWVSSTVEWRLDGQDLCPQYNVYDPHYNSLISKRVL